MEKFLLFSFYQKDLKTVEFSFQPESLLKIEFFRKSFWWFLRTFNKHLFWWTLIRRCSWLYLTRPVSIVQKQRHFHLMLKKHNCTAFFTIYRKENANSVCNFQFMKSPKELNSFYQNSFVILQWTTCKRGFYVKSYCFFETMA